MTVPGNRRRRTDMGRRVPGSRMPGTLETPAAVRQAVNAEKVAQDSQQQAVTSSIVTLETTTAGLDVAGINATLQDYAQRIDQLENSA